MDLQTIRETIQANKDTLRAFGITRIGIFGSAANGTATEDSDIDVLLDFDPEKKTYRNFYEGTTCLESLLQHPVDSVTPQSLSPYIKPYIDKTITYVQIAS